MGQNSTQLASGVVALCALCSSAHANLLGRDLDGNAATFEAYYDTTLDVTWLADANHASTTGHAVNGYMHWDDAMAWAAALSFTDGVHVYDNWRLPLVGPVNGSGFIYTNSNVGTTDWGYNVSASGTAHAGSTASEMAHLFHNTLGNAGKCDPTTSSVNVCVNPPAVWGLTNTGPFINFAEASYWSATEFAITPNPNRAWRFDFNNGFQGDWRKDLWGFALAVTPGDVAAVPEAHSWAYLLAGLAGLGATQGRRRDVRLAR
jgi:hypothetical protein